MPTDPFAIRPGHEAVGGMSIEIGRGPRALHGRTPSIEISDTAYSFVEPVLARIAPTYHPDTRFGIGEFDATVWRSAASAFRLLAERLRGGGALAASDVAWVPTVDLDTGAETTAQDFIGEIDTPEHRPALQTFLVAIATWIEDSLEHEAVLTVYGY